MSQKEREQLFAEFSILSTLQHPNIVGYYHREHLKPIQELHLYMEYCGGGDLGVYIKNLKLKNEFASEAFIWSTFSQLVIALYRCHYGRNAPELGANNEDPEESRGLRTKLGSKAQIMILHRDLKPDNVFLGADNSVKLGDFGLSKLMQSHDFASTYVGTPYYMSPEICASEKYTLQSDVWSLGCIMYELCTREPPFNGGSYLDLVKNIRAGRFKDIPAHYSPELSSIIRSCLKTNPDSRPKTANLLTHPSIRLYRREKEVVDMGKCLKDRELTVARKADELREKMIQLEDARHQMRVEIDASLRREWEVKARLEIDRQVSLEKEALQKEFERILAVRVAEGVQEYITSLKSSTQSETSGTHSATFDHESSSNGNTSSTDLSVLSLPSPSDPILTTQKSQVQELQKHMTGRPSRGPLARSRTTFDTPGDIPMADASPMSIASLSLSPRRTAATAAYTHSPTARKNIFTLAAAQKAKWEPISNDDLVHDDAFVFSEHTIHEDDEDNLPDLPSPTRPQRVNKLAGVVDPFFKPLTGGAAPPLRPGLRRQVTAPNRRVSGGLPKQQASLFSGEAAAIKIKSPVSPAAMARAPMLISPNRKVERSYATDGGSPVRKAPPRPSFGGRGQLGKVGGIASNVVTGTDTNMARAVLNKNAFAGEDKKSGFSQGRTLVELQQERVAAGGQVAHEPVGTKGIGWENVEVTEWNPDTDDMPSPFLQRGKARLMI
ncbi:G2-specific serine/threonine protein kinase [Agyrium rufum]|nr:G2-specific serine/threonine protein kinase [Agyrium rufum]